LLLKLKPKRKTVLSSYSIGKKSAAFVALFVVIVTCFLPSRISAADGVTYQSTELSLSLKTSTPGATAGSFKPDNLIQVGKSQTSAPIKAELTVTTTSSTAPSALNIGSDTLNTGASGGSPIAGVAAGLDIIGQGANAGGVDCHPDVIATLGWSVLVGNITANNFTSCDFKDKEHVTTSMPYKTPSTVNITVNFASYKLDANNTTTPQSIIIYPYLELTRLGVTRNLVNTSGGFPLYVQFYDTQDAANAAIASGQRPNGVPAYNGGSNSTIQQLQKNKASVLAGLISDIVNVVLGVLQEFIYALFFWLVAPVIQSLLSIHPYTDTFVAVIYPGWEVVRNLCNIFFIVALIIIALATLFRVDSYQYKHLIVQLILAALLVNFSLVIGQAILGLADTVQAQFLPANVTVIRSLSGDLMVGYRSTLKDAKGLFNGSFADIIQPLFWLALSVGSFAVFCAIAAFLLIRIVALWILLLISPIAYAVGVLPSTAQYRKKWWENFLKYAFFTPIMAFFLNMTAVISNTYKQNPVLSSVMQPDVAASFNNDTLAGFIFRVASNILLLVFLIAALKVADMAGIYGASAVTGLAQKAVFSPFAGAKYLGKDVVGGYVQKRYNNLTAGLATGGTFSKALYAGLHIPSTVKAFRKDSSEDLQRSKDLTDAAALSVKRRVPLFKRKGEDPLVLYNERKGKELLEERRGETSDSEQDEVKFALKLYEDAKKGDKDAQLMLPEQMRRMFKNHNINEFVEQFGFTEGIDGVKLGDEKKRVLKYNRDNLRGVLNEMQKNGGMSAKVNEEYQKRLGTLGYASDDFTGNELTYTDENGKAHLIQVEFNPKTRAFEAVGQKEYDALQEYARKNSVNQADFDKTVKDLEAETGPKFAAFKSAFKSANPTLDFNIGRYKNARQDRAKINERNINITKKDALIQTKQWWESQMSTDADGNIVFGATGAEVYTHLNSGHEFHGSRGNQVERVQEKYLPLVLDNPTQLRAELEKVIKQQAAYKGTFLNDTQLAHEVDKAEYANLRMAYAVEKRDLTNTGLGKYDIDPADYKAAITKIRKDLPKSKYKK